MRELAKTNRADEIIKIIEQFAIKRHCDSLDFVKYLEIEEKKPHPDLKTIDLYKRLMTECSQEGNTACKLLDIINGLPAGKTHYVNYRNEIATISFDL